MNFENELRIARRSNDSSKLKIVYEAIYNEYVRLVYFSVSRYCADKEDIKDIVSDVFVKFFENPDGVKDSIKQYLLAVAKNEAINRMKREGKINIDEIEPTINDEYSTYSIIVKDMMSVLKQEEVDIIILHVVDGLSFKEIARKKNLKEGTLRQTYNRALGKYREARS